MDRWESRSGDVAAHSASLREQYRRKVEELRREPAEGTAAVPEGRSCRECGDPAGGDEPDRQVLRNSVPEEGVAEAEAEGRRTVSSNGRTPCKGTNAAGEPCGSPLVGEDGYCDAHRPGGEHLMRLRGRMGAEATRRKWLAKNLSADELPPLQSPSDVKRWSEEVAAAVATGRLAASAGNAIKGLLDQWLRGHEATQVAEKLREVEAKLRRLERSGERSKIPVERQARAASRLRPPVAAPSATWNDPAAFSRLGALPRGGFRSEAPTERLPAAVGFPRPAQSPAHVHVPLLLRFADPPQSGFTGRRSSMLSWPR